MERQKTKVLTKEEYQKSRKEFAEKHAEWVKEERKRLGISIDTTELGKVLTRGEKEHPGILTTGNISLKEKEPERDPAKPGLQASDLDENLQPKPLSDEAYILKYAKPEEVKKLRAEIEKRLEKSDQKQTLPNGLKVPASHKLYGCRNCKKWFWAAGEKMTNRCPVCGQERAFEASKKQTSEWMKAEEKKFADLKASESQRKKDLAEFNRRLFQFDRDDFSDLKARRK